MSSTVLFKQIFIFIYSIFSNNFLILTKQTVSKHILSFERQK